MLRPLRQSESQLCSLIWENEDFPDYGRLVLTAYAAARIPASPELVEHAPALISSMLTAGLDRDAAAWSQTVEPGSDAWALIAVGTQRRWSN